MNTKEAQNQRRILASKIESLILEFEKLSEMQVDGVYLRRIEGFSGDTLFVTVEVKLPGG